MYTILNIPLPSSMIQHKREVTIALCGIAVGLMLGAGLLMSDASLVTSSLFAFGPARTHVIPRADILRGPRASSFQAPVAGSSSSEAVADTPACASARDAVTAFLSAIDQALPARPANLAARQKLQTAVQAYLSRTCAVAPSAEAASSSSVRSVDNQCERYGRRTDRYATCIGYQRQGRVYPDPTLAD